MSQPQLVGEVVVAYVAGNTEGEEAGREFLTAWDLADGAVLWRHEAAPGKNPTGMEHSVAALEADGTWFVSFLAPSDQDPLGLFPESLRVVEAATGEAIDAELGRRAVSAHRPTTCHDARAFCIVGMVSDANAAFDQTFSYEPGDEELQLDRSAEAPHVGDASYLGAGISLSADDDVHYGQGGELRWARSFVDIFGPTSSPHAGFSWTIAGDDDQLLIGAGRPWHPRRESGTYTELLAEGRVVGLDRETGATLWSVDGALPCAGVDAVEAYGGVVALCVFRSGTVRHRWTRSDSTDFRYSNVDLDLIGLSSVTGKTLWTVPLESDERTAQHVWDERPDLLSGEEIVASIAGVAHEIDRETGRATPVETDAVVLCTAPYREVELDNAGVASTYVAFSGVGFCSAAGEESPHQTLSEATLGLLGVKADRVIPLLVGDELSVYLPSKS